MIKATRHFITGLVAAAFVLLAAPAAFAVTRDQIKQCEGATDVSADQRIASCNAVIAGGTKAQKEAAQQHKTAALKAKTPAKPAAVQPSVTSPLIARGIASRANGDAESAIRDFDEAIQLDPKQADAYFNRGLALRDRGDTDRALQDFEQTIKLDPKNSAAYKTLSHLYYDKRNYDLAIAVLDTAIRNNQNDALAYYNRGMTYRAKGEPDRAIPDYDRAIKLNDSDAVAYQIRGLAYRDRRD